MKYEIDMILPSLNDYIYAFTDTFEYGKETKVILEIEES